MIASLLRSIAVIVFTVGIVMPSAGPAYADPTVEPTVPVPPPADTVVTGSMQGSTISEPITIPSQANDVPPQPPPVVVPSQAPVALPAQAPVTAPEPVIPSSPPVPEPVVVSAPQPAVPPVVVAPLPVAKPAPERAPAPIEAPQQPVRPDTAPQPAVKPAPVIVEPPSVHRNDAPMVVSPPVQNQLPVTVPEQVRAPEQVATPANGDRQAVTSVQAEVPKPESAPQNENVKSQTDKLAVPVNPPKPADNPVIPPEVFAQAPVTAKVERVSEHDDSDRPGRNGRDDDHDGNNDHDNDRDRPPRPGHDRPDNPWGGHDEHDNDHHDNGGNGHHDNDNDGDGQHGDHHGPPPKPPVVIDHDGDHIVITNVFNTVINNTTIINQQIVNPTSYIYLRNWDTNQVLRFHAGIDGRFVLPTGWCGGAGGYWSVSAGISALGFSAYGGAGGFFTSGGCGYLPPPPPPVAYPPQLYVAPPFDYYGAAPMNLGPYYIPDQGCGCVYAPDYNTTFYGGFQDQQFVPTGYAPETIFQQAPTPGYPEWLDEGFGGLPNLPEPMHAELSTVQRAAFFALATLVLSVAGYMTVRMVRKPQGDG